jgi:tetratricopeptide (TPR) repeat protein
MRLSEQTDDLERLLLSILNILSVSLPLGNTRAATKAFEDLNRLATRHQRPFYLYCVMSARVALATFQGRYEGCEKLAQEAFAFGQTLPGLDGTGAYSLQMFSLCREQGRLTEMAPLVRHFVQTTPREGAWRLGLALIYAELGMRNEAQTEFASLIANDFAAIPEDATWLYSMGMLAETCHLLVDAQAAASLYDLLLPYAHCNIVAPPLVALHGVAARHLGMLASTMKRCKEAEGHFELALELNDRQGSRPFVAHTQHQYAQMLLARNATGDRERAKQLLVAALATARELRMNALAERAATVQEGV